MTRICSLRVMVSHKQFGIFCFTLIQFLFMYVGYISDSDGRTTFCNVIKLCSNHIISQRGFIPKGLMAPFYQKKEEMSYLIVYDRFLKLNSGQKVRLSILVRKLYSCHCFFLLVLDNINNHVNNIIWPCPMNFLRSYLSQAFLTISVSYHSIYFNRKGRFL